MSSNQYLYSIRRILLTYFDSFVSTSIIFVSILNVFLGDVDFISNIILISLILIFLVDVVFNSDKFYRSLRIEKVLNFNYKKQTELTFKSCFYLIALTDFIINPTTVSTVFLLPLLASIDYYFITIFFLLTGFYLSTKEYLKTFLTTN